MINAALLTIGYTCGLCYAGTTELAVCLSVSALLVVSNVNIRFPETSTPFHDDTDPFSFRDRLNPQTISPFISAILFPESPFRIDRGHNSPRSSTSRQWGLVDVLRLIWVLAKVRPGPPLSICSCSAGYVGWPTHGGSSLVLSCC